MTFTAGPGLIDPVVGDPSREAIASLRGYAYQLYMSALAWIGLAQSEVLHLEVAEDYAVATRKALDAVQVKDAAASGNLTLRHKDVIQAIDNFVHLHRHNPGRRITLRFLSTAEIGREKAVKDRPGGVEGLIYWRRAAGGEDVAPLRAVLEALPLKEGTLAFIKSRDDASLRDEMLRRLHWDGARPDFAAVREEFDVAMVALGQQHLLTVNESRQLAGILLMTALDVIVTPGDRRLTTLDLKEKVEATTHIAVPRRQLEALLQQTQGISDARPDREMLLLPEAGTPLPKLLARRRPLVEHILQRVRADGAAMLNGGTGAGKTLLARLVARQRVGDWRIVDLYGVAPRELVARLDAVLAANALESFDGLILDDVNGHEDPGVERALARLAEALRRRDRPLIITSYQAPTVRLCDALSVMPESAIAVARLTTRETADLVADAEGDPDRWARPIHAAAGPGHPQLVQAMIADFRRRGWPAEEVGKLERLELGDLLLAEEREAARRRLIQAANPDARKLLYRLGVVLGRFKRPLALELGALPSPVLDGGVCLDDLTGPWIDRLADGRLRLSPLLDGISGANLSETELTEVRRRIAELLLTGSDLDVRDVGEGFVQALASSAEPQLLHVGLAVIGTNNDQLKDLGFWLLPLRALRHDRPIYPANPTISRLLRLSQVLLAAEAETSDGLAQAWAALKSELAAEPDEQARVSFECMALAKLLFCKAFAREVDDWLSWLVRFDHLTRTTDKFRGMMETYERKAPKPHGNVIGFIFHLLALSLPSVASLLKCFEDLDRLEPDVRARLLSDLKSGGGDAGILLNHAWVADKERGKLDGAAAADSYGRIASIAEGWKQPDLATRALIARSVMFDEYLDDRDRAAATLDFAEARFGKQVAIGRARAKIFYRRKEHAQALDMIGALAEQLGDDVVERAFVFREAGISAGELGRWSEARRWFLAAHEAASLSDSSSMKAMAAGLLGDIAVVAQRDGDSVEAIRRMAFALEALDDVDPEGSLKGAYVHRAVRHAVLWLNSELTGTYYEHEVERLPPQAPAGFCSNPDPLEAIKQQALTALAGVWYLIAQADLAIDGAAGEAARVHERLGGKIIQGMEAMLRRSEMAWATRTWKTKAFPELAERFLDGFLWLRDVAVMDDAAGLPVVDGPLPRPSPAALQKPETKGTVQNFLIHIAVAGVLGARPDTLDQLQRVARRLEVAGYPGTGLVHQAMSDPESGEAKAMAAWFDLGAHDPPAPRQVWAAGFYLLNMRGSLLFDGRFEDTVDRWVRTSWEFVIGRQRFLLASPPVAEEALKVVLSSSLKGYALLAEVLRAMRSQVGFQLNPSVAEYLKNA